jgi:hypothetical protein
VGRDSSIIGISSFSFLWIADHSAVALREIVRGSVDAPVYVYFSKQRTLEAILSPTTIIF